MTFCLFHRFSVKLEVSSCRASPDNASWHKSNYPRFYYYGNDANFRMTSNGCKSFFKKIAHFSVFTLLVSINFIFLHTTFLSWDSSKISHKSRFFSVPICSLVLSALKSGEDVLVGTWQSLSISFYTHRYQRSPGAPSTTAVLAGLPGHKTFINTLPTNQQHLEETPQ